MAAAGPGPGGAVRPALVAPGRRRPGVPMSRLLARLQDVEFADASVAHVELWLSDQPVEEEESVFAAMVVVGDVAGRFVVVYSPRREEWGSPGGWRERGESVVECALREVAEETGLRLAPGDLSPVGF